MHHSIRGFTGNDFSLLSITPCVSSHGTTPDGVSIKGTRVEAAHRDREGWKLQTLEYNGYVGFSNIPNASSGIRTAAPGAGLLE